MSSGLEASPVDAKQRTAEDAQSASAAASAAHARRHARTSDGTVPSIVARAAFAVRRKAADPGSPTWIASAASFRSAA